MNTVAQMITEEEKRAAVVVAAMRSTLAGEEIDRQTRDREIRELKAEKLDAVG